MRKLIDLPDGTVRRLVKIAKHERRSVKSWIEHLVIRTVSDKPVDTIKPRRNKPTGWHTVSRTRLQSAAHELNEVLEIEPRIVCNLTNRKLIEKLKEAEKIIDWEVDYLTEETINTLKDIKS